MNKTIWQDQLKFNRLFFKNSKLDLSKLSVEQKVKWAKEFHFHISRELSDLLNCLPNWKMHYKSDDSHISSNLKEEVIDSFKYFMGLAQVLGLSYEELISAYWEKTAVVQQKYRQSFELEKLKKKKVVIFDIDGVINTFPDCFLEWVKRTYKISCDNYNELKERVDLKKYCEIKERYRTSGAKRTLPINKATVELMRLLKKKGETIVLYTVRPVAKYKRIFADTLYWLKKNKVPFDAIFWSDYHKEDIYKLGFKIKFIVEDNKDNAALFNHEKYKVYLIDNQYNRGYEHPLLVRIVNPMMILQHEYKLTPYQIAKLKNDSKKK